jgi:hypothetical protein
MDPDAQKVMLDRANTITEVKNQILSEGIKGLFLINGGGAVALATWLQAVWDKPWAAPMLTWQLYGMSVYALGVFFGAFSPLARYLVFLHKNTNTPTKNPWWWTHIAATVLSILCFAVASGFVVRGGLVALENRAALAPNSGVQPTPKSGAADAKR